VISSTGKMLIVMLVIIVTSTSPALAIGPGNARLHGFGGAGIAIAPKDGQTAMAVNPAAPAFLRQRQLNLNLTHGDRKETGENIYYLERTDEPSSWGGGLEGYLPFELATVFGGIGGESETRNWREEMLGEGTMLWGDGHTRDTWLHLGVAGAVHEMVALGGQWLSWTRSLEEEGRGWSYDETDTFHAGEAGLLIVTPAQLNFGLTWRSGDSNDGITLDHQAKGINEMLRIGAAFQKRDGSWLLGIEYVDRQPISLDEITSFYNLNFEEEMLFGEELVHLYGEYRFGSVSARAGLCWSRSDGSVPEFDPEHGDPREYFYDTEHLLASFGISGRITDTVGWEFFLQQLFGDSRADLEGHSRPVYEYESTARRIGLGLTFFN